MGRNIRVTGKGKLSVKPDTICLAIEAEGVFPDYEKTIKESADQTKVLRKLLEKSGLSGKDLKTKHFSIQAEMKVIETSMMIIREDLSVINLSIIRKSDFRMTTSS